MNFIELESPQKLRGGFYTDPAIAAFLTAWVGAIQPRRVLEPSCGDGAFLATLAEAGLPGLREVVACELDPAEAECAARRTRLALQLERTDFLRWYLFHARDGEPFDAVLGNPPFIRYQYLGTEQQFLAERIFRELRLPFTKHTNAWVPFVLASLQLLRPGGRLAMVVPAELLHIRHAQPLRSYLARQCSRVLILDPEELWFTDTLQGTVLLLAQKRQAVDELPNGVAVLPITGRRDLDLEVDQLAARADYWKEGELGDKWLPLLLTRREHTLLQQMRAHPQVKRFVELASVDVGIVTGANQFFLVPDQTVEAFQLHPWAHPMFGRSEHALGLVYSAKDHAVNKASGLPANFLWFNDAELNSYPEPVQRYLAQGVSGKLPSRYKCRVREPWFAVPSVYKTPVAMLKRAHNYPRLILNEAGAFTTDTAYRITPSATDPASLVFSFVNSLTCLSAELEGRHYGGGVLELVPSEIERLLIPVVPASPAELQAADARFRSAPHETEFLREQDPLILGSIGLRPDEQEELYQAWFRFRNRRHRRTHQANKFDPSEESFNEDAS